MSDVVLDEVGLNLRVAGRYAAWVDAERGGDIVVYDLLRGEEAYRVVAPAHGIGGQLDLQDDGKVAFTVGAPAASDNGGQRLGWASAEAPSVHLLPVAPREGYWLKLAEDMVVFERGNRASRRGELGLVGLSGPAQILMRPVQTPADGHDELLDFDGRRLAWLTGGCQGPTVHTEQLSDLTERPALKEPPACPLRLRRPPRPTSGGRLTVHPSCVGLERSCAADDLVLRAASRYRLGPRRISPGTRLSTTKAARSTAPGVYQLRLTPTGRELVRQPKPLRATLAARIFDLTTLEKRRATLSIP